MSNKNENSSKTLLFILELAFIVEVIQVEMKNTIKVKVTDAWK